MMDSNPLSESVTTLNRRLSETRVHNQRLEDELVDAYTAACQLLIIIGSKHFPEWKPSVAPDLAGVITQIDHLTAHMVRA